MEKLPGSRLSLSESPLTTCSEVESPFRRLKRRRVQWYCPHAPTQVPSNKQRAPTQEPALSKTKRVASLVSWPLPVLSCRAAAFFGIGYLVLVPCPGGFCSVFFGFFSWPRASRSCSRMGGTSGQTSFPFRLTGTDPSTGFSRYPFASVTLVFRFVLVLDFLVSSTRDLYHHHCGHRTL